MSKLSNLRKRLYNQNPNCPFCGIKMILPEDVELKTKTYPDNLCTIEHIYSKFNPLRQTPNTNGERRRIVCCKKCNMIRGREEELSLGVEGLQRHAQQKRLKRKSKVTEAGFEPTSLGSKPNALKPVTLLGNVQRKNLFSKLLSFILPKMN
jgi:hypothetical protein